MLDHKGDAVTLPQAVKCHCEKGYLLPILQPVTGQHHTFNMGPTKVWGDKYQVTWECSYCHITVKGGIQDV